jgi:hypothetical protein
MKFIPIIICSIVWSNFGYSQFKEIRIAQIGKLQVMELRCLDSGRVISNNCSLVLDGIHVEFYKAFINQKEREVRLIGRSGSICGIDIFQAVKMENRLIDKKMVSETSCDKANINNDGFFDITMKVENNESLFFHETLYFLREFSVYKLFQK